MGWRLWSRSQFDGPLSEAAGKRQTPEKHPITNFPQGFDVIPLGGMRGIEAGSYIGF